MRRDKEDLPAVVYTESSFADIVRSLSSAFSYLLRKWWVIALAGFIGGVIGVMYAWMQEPKYQSRLTFALEESGGNLSGALSIAAEFGFNLGGGKDIFEGDNILEIFTSRSIIERVLLSADSAAGKPATFADKFLALKFEGERPPRLKGISFPLGQPREQFTYLQDSALYILYQDIVKTDLSVSKPDKKLSIYEINFTSSSESFAKAFTEKLVEETTEFYTELRSRRSRETLEILEARVEELKGSLNSAISGRSSIQDANLNPAFAAAQAPLQKKQVDITVYGGAYGELYKNLELARYQYLKTIPLLQVIDEPNYPLKKIKKGRLATGLMYAIIFGLLCTIFLLARRQYRIIMNRSEPVTA